MGDAVEIIATIGIGAFYAVTFLAVCAAVEAAYAVAAWLRRK